MAVLSTAQMLQYIQDFIKSKVSNVDCQPGSDLYDLLLSSTAQASRRIFDEIERLQNNQSVLTIDTRDLDLIAKSYNIVRRGATFATGEVTFFTTDFTADISIPVNSLVSTKGTNVTSPVRFKTTRTVGMLVANKSTYWNATNARYQVTVPVISEVSGTAGNIDTNIISEMVVSVPNIDGVTNLTPTTGGVSSESDDSVKQRMLQSFVSSSIGTRYGYKKLLTDNFEEVLDVTAIGPFDAEAKRPTGVDLFTIISNIDDVANTITTIDSFQYTTEDTGHLFVNRPVISVNEITAVKDTSTWIPIQYPTLDSDYRFFPDTTGANALSVNAYDVIKWDSSSILRPDNGSTVLVGYTYNAKVQELQTFINLDENKVVGANSLVKLGVEGRAFITITLGYFPNVDVETAKLKVSNALSQFLSEMLFGEDLELSDLVIVAQTGKWSDYNITEVDYVVITDANCYVTFERTGETRNMVNGLISVDIHEFLREGLITIN